MNALTSNSNKSSQIMSCNATRGASEQSLICELNHYIGGIMKSLIIVLAFVLASCPAFAQDYNQKSEAIGRDINRQQVRQESINSQNWNRQNSAPSYNTPSYRPSYTPSYTPTYRYK